MADRPSFDERLAAIIRDENSETHKALVEATTAKKTPTSKSSTPAKK
jgi:hypothetical protein